MKNRGSTPLLTNLVGVQLRNIHNIGQISAAVQEKESTMGYYIVTYIVIHCKYTSYVTTQKLISIIQ